MNCKVDTTVHNCYNDIGKDFEELLAEAIRQVNLDIIQKGKFGLPQSDNDAQIRRCKINQKQIITSTAASRKEASQ